MNDRARYHEQPIILNFALVKHHYTMNRDNNLTWIREPRPALRRPLAPVKPTYERVISIAISVTTRHMYIFDRSVQEYKKLKRCIVVKLPKTNRSDEKFPTEARTYIVCMTARITTTRVAHEWKKATVALSFGDSEAEYSKALRGFIRHYYGSSASITSETHKFNEDEVSQSCFVVKQIIAPQCKIPSQYFPISTKKKGRPTQREREARRASRGQWRSPASSSSSAPDASSLQGHVPSITPIVVHSTASHGAPVEGPQKVR